MLPRILAASVAFSSANCLAASGPGVRNSDSSMGVSFSLLLPLCPPSGSFLASVCLGEILLSSSVSHFRQYLSFRNSFPFFETNSERESLIGLSAKSPEASKKATASFNEEKARPSLSLLSIFSMGYPLGIPWVFLVIFGL